MSKSSNRKESRYTISPTSHCYVSNQSREYIHESQRFYVKGKNNNINGIVLSKHPQGTRSIEIVDKDGKTIMVPWKVFYFDLEDVDKEIVIITEDFQELRFKYSPHEKRIIEVKKPPIEYHPNYLY